LIEDGRQVVVLTTQNAPGERQQALQVAGLRVLIAGEDHVNGETAVNLLSSNGYQTIYSAAGPRVLHLLLEAGVLDRLYLTTAARMLGGAPFSTLMEGPLLKSPTDFILQHLYYDAQAPGPGGQLFAAFDHKANN
jgi:riboflavin biosynthesis pyrimidine reductase